MLITQKKLFGANPNTFLHSSWYGFADAFWSFAQPKLDTSKTLVQIHYFTAIFFQLFIFKSKSESILSTRAYAQVLKMEFDFDFKINSWKNRAVTTDSISSQNNNSTNTSQGKKYKNSCLLQKMRTSQISFHQVKIDRKLFLLPNPSFSNCKKWIKNDIDWRNDELAIILKPEIWSLNNQSQILRLF